MKSLFFSLALLFLSPVPALAASFTAEVDKDHVKAGESFTLQLTLSDTEAHGVPDTGALKQFFTIASESQSLNTITGNGVLGVRAGWQLTLVPKVEGRLTIPPMAIQTGAGVLHTAPVVLQVDHGPAQTSSYTGVDGSTISITAMASTAAPYQNQSIRYTVRCVTRGDISDASLGDVDASNAIVERQGEPEIRDQVENGVGVKVIEFHYIITPLQAGKITISPVVLQGKISAPDTAAGRDSGGVSSKLQQAMNFFSAFGGEPFSVASNGTVLDVKSPTTAMDPWLPLTSLKIVEDMDTSQPVRVGEPLTRKITLLADGAVGSQLPDLEARQDHKDFRVYADKPTIGEDIDSKSGVILGWRKESYTLIAQKAGRLVLPAIKVSWWDIVNNKIATAELPERAVGVLPIAPAHSLPPTDAGTARRSAAMQPSQAQSLREKFGSAFFYVLIAILAAALSLAAFWGLKICRKITRKKANDVLARAAAKPQGGKSAPRRVSKRDLDRARTAEELKEFLQAYAHQHRGISKNASLDESLSGLSNSWAQRDDIAAVIHGIGAALYAGRVVDVEDLKKRCRRIIAAPNRASDNSQKSGEKLRYLNPR
jgi:BatD DUF11 like domain